MAVTPEVQSVLDVIAAFGGPALEDQTPEEVRQSFATLNSLGIATKVDMASARDRAIPGPRATSRCGSTCPRPTRDHGPCSSTFTAAVG